MSININLRIQMWCFDMHGYIPWGLNKILGDIDDESSSANVAAHDWRRRCFEVKGLEKHSRGAQKDFILLGLRFGTMNVKMMETYL